ncbi:unnamed protein product [Tuber melanosporum]|uniref:(Perigord truffle) hypothetical protein n=1 Tax=Tuber melanosporum (strain Mel28) TaxID=656061 RepID=D5G8X5_TUBMM|nr:uncharacterized protein GSTUM_00004886001 [Tuber melanosporum]CAZ80968.1 unnamed protein product [Tuber melanosporum]
MAIFCLWRSGGTSTFKCDDVRCGGWGCTKCHNPTRTDPKTSNQKLISTSGARDLGQRWAIGNTSRPSPKASIIGIHEHRQFLGQESRAAAVRCDINAEISENQDTHPSRY